MALLCGIALVSVGSVALLTIIPVLIKEENPQHDSGAIIGLLMNSADLGMALASLAGAAARREPVKLKPSATKATCANQALQVFHQWAK